VAAARRQLLDLIRALVDRAQHAGTLRRDLGWQDIPLLAGAVPTAGRCVVDLPATPRQVDRCVTVLIDGLRTVSGPMFPTRATGDHRTGAADPPSATAGDGVTGVGGCQLMRSARSKATASLAGTVTVARPCALTTTVGPEQEPLRVKPWTMSQ